MNLHNEYFIFMRLATKYRCTIYYLCHENSCFKKPLVGFPEYLLIEQL